MYNKLLEGFPYHTAKVKDDTYMEIQETKMRQLNRKTYTSPVPEMSNSRCMHERSDSGV